jgi:DNA polymerase-3 subunit epsilon
LIAVFCCRKKCDLQGTLIDGSEVAVCIDTEITGLDCILDKIIEIGLVAFEYDPATFRIIRIIDRYSGFENPGVPLSKEITEITGISDAMLSGKSFDNDQVARLAGQAYLVVAHNASFDRKFVEARFPIFKEIPWACTVTQVNWAAERIGSRTLEFLLY